MKDLWGLKDLTIHDTGHSKRCKFGASYFDPLDPEKRFRR